MTSYGIFINGGFAPYCVVEESQLYKFNPKLDWESAAFAEPLSCCVNGICKVRVFPGQSVVIMGCGPMGLYFVQLYKASGACPVVVIEPKAYRRNKAIELGADVGLDPTCQDIKKQMLDLTGIGADVVVDAVGTLLGNALDLVRSGGKVLVLGMNEAARVKVAPYWIVRREIEIVGTFISHHSFPSTLRILERGLINVKGMISHRLPLGRIHDAIEIMKSGECIKVIIDCQN